MDKLLFGSIVTLLGLGMTFATLVIMIFVVKAMSAAVNGLVKNKQERSEKGTDHAVQANASAAVSNDVIKTPVSAEQEGELIAAISAAIAAYLGDQAPKGGFAIRSVQRITSRTGM